MNKRIFTIVILVAAMTMILVQCTPAPAEAPASTDAHAATDASAAASAPAATDAPAQAEPIQATVADAPAPAGLDGQGLVESRCADCHSLDRVTSASKTEDGWKKTVEHMVKKGAQLNADEQVAVIQYLANTYK